MKTGRISFFGTTPLVEVTGTARLRRGDDYRVGQAIPPAATGAGTPQARRPYHLKD